MTRRANGRMACVGAGVFVAMLVAGGAGGQVVVELDAADQSAGAVVWRNRVKGGGDFSRVGAPKVETVEKVRAVAFDGKKDAYVGPDAPAGLTGAGARTVEVWALNPHVDSAEEAVVAWGKRGGQAGGFSLNIGLRPAAVSTGGEPIAWGDGHPMEDEWHHLVFTYDGKTYALYDNGSRRAGGACELKTASGGKIVVGAQCGEGGGPLFAAEVAEKEGKVAKVQLGGSVRVAVVRIHAAAMTAEQVAASFALDARRFGAVALDALDAQRCPWPRELASVFSFGYARDVMPARDADFERLVKTVKGLGFNVIHATYTPGRLAVCRKYGMKMMVDAISGTDHHVWATPIKVKKAAISLRGNADVWGYNLWNDPFGEQGGTLRAHVRSLRLWDPTHPVYCGTYHWPAAREITNGDMPGYYDFHWERGIRYHLPNCSTYLGAARRNKGMWGTWLSTTPGKAGAERVGRSLWSANVAMAFGCKTILWFLGQSIVDPKTLAPLAGVEDFRQINAQVMPLRAEMMKLGLPAAVYSTPMTKDMKDEAVAPTAPAPHTAAFPAGFVAQPAGGQFLAGAFKDEKGRDVLLVVNYNACAGQTVKLSLAGGARASVFGRKEGAWHAARTIAGVVELALPPGGGELVRVEPPDASR